MGETSAAASAATYQIRRKPFYLPIADEIQVFEAAWIEQAPLLLKGPTSCGKTRFVEYMAYTLGQKVLALRSDNGHLSREMPALGTGVGLFYTVACQEDLTARDLTGRYLIQGGETVRVDGPAAMVVREGAVLYLDEVVKARKDVGVVIHPLTDYRRMLLLKA